MDRPFRNRPRWIRQATSFFQRKPQYPDSYTQVYPPSPREMLSARLDYTGPSLSRSIKPQDDCPLDALYRIYEHIMLGRSDEVRNEFEQFWYHSSWQICDIPDPLDPDPERYAVVACIPALMCVAFNERIRLGLPRTAPPVFTKSALDYWRRQERVYETEPEWAHWVPQLNEKLVIPHWDNEKKKYVLLKTFEAEKASKEFERKNILIGQPHIHFT